jgi:hypothetical protein
MPGLDPGTHSVTDAASSTVTEWIAKSHPDLIRMLAMTTGGRSGKITEVAVRDVGHGREVKKKEALADPEALELYRGLEELRT